MSVAVTIKGKIKWRRIIVFITIFLRSEQYCIRTVPDLVLYALLDPCAFAWTKLHTLKVYTLGHSNKLVVKRISWLVFSNMENKFNSCLNTFLEEQNFKVESLLRMRRMRIIQCDWCSDKLCMKIHGIPSCIFMLVIIITVRVTLLIFIIVILQLFL